MSTQTQWTAPTAITAIPSLTQLFQHALLFIPPHFVNAQHLSYIRAAILPMCIYGIWTCYSHPQHSYFLPAREFMHLNIVLQVGKYLGIFKAIELALCDEKEYRWMGYEWAYRDHVMTTPGHVSNDATAPVGDEGALEKLGKQVEQPKHLDLEPEQGQRYGRTIAEILWLAWRCNFALRGIGWSFGIKGRQIPPQYGSKTFIRSLFTRLLLFHIVTVSLYAFLQYSRELSREDPSMILSGVLNLSSGKHDQIRALRQGIKLFSRLIQSLAFGIAIYTSIEIDAIYVTTLAWLIANAFRAIIPARSITAGYIRPDKFNLKAWPKPSFRPLLSESITELWGKRWHALFRRTFIATGARPAMKLAHRMGIQNRSIKMSFGALGAFIVSAIIHESIIDASPWLPREALSKSALFFVLQAVAVFMESMFTSITGRRVRGKYGRIWSWAFMLTTGILMTESWLKRGIVDNTPPLSQWEWWRWAVPNALIVPNFNKPRVYQLHAQLQGSMAPEQLT